MTAFSDIVNDPDNHPIPGVKVYVYTRAGVLAFTEPFTTDQFGRFNFDVADGVYRLDYWFGGKKVDSENRIIGNPPEYKGDPGGNILAVGVFANAASMAIPAGTEMVRTASYLTPTPPLAGTGAAFYVHDPIVDAAFVTAHPAWSFRSADGRGWRLDKEQRVFFEMFGAVGNALSATVGTDNYNAWLAAKDFIHYYRVFPYGNAYYKPSVPLYFSAAGYEFSNYLDLTDAAYEMFGSGSTGGGQGGGTTFFFSSTCGIILQSWDTAGVSTTNQPNNAGTPHGASSSHLRDLLLVSRAGTLDAAQYGILVKCTGCHFERVTAIGFGNDGWHIYGQTSGAGNANSNHLDFCGGHNNGGSGLYLGGGDANACVSTGFQATSNRRYGIAEGSFLGNLHTGYHIASNGQPQSFGCGPAWAAANTISGARVRYSGHTWLCAPGQLLAASTTTPGTNAAVWVDQGTTDPGHAEGWISGHKYQDGGALYIGGASFLPNNNNASYMVGYCEQDQPAGWGDSSASICIRAGSGGAGPGYYAQLGAILSSKIGARTQRADGTLINAMLGGDATNNEWLLVGNGDNPNWKGQVSTLDELALSWAGGSPTLRLNPSSLNVPAVDMPRGMRVSNVQIKSATSAPTSGYFERGSFVANESAVAGGTPGWCAIPTTGGATAGWIATVAWQASHAYFIGDLVTNDTGKSYRCTTAGTSAASGGPTGTSSAIADGTCVWAYSAGFAMKALANMAA